ncbi:MAG: ABC transporter ATP-binding protein [Lachnospiraceae bacterium]|nr:ABC transporter ATP-binding protein [Lachnospiraceae bacterium]
MQQIEKFSVLWNKFQTILSTSQKKWGIVIFLMSIMGAIVETLGVSVILPLVQVMLDPNQLLEIPVIKEIFYFTGVSDTNQMMIVVAIAVIMVYIIKNIYMAILSYARARYSTKVQRELSIRMMHSYIKRGYPFFRVNNTATLLRGSNGAMVGVYSVIYNFMRIVAEALTMLCILIFIVYTDWKMAVSMIGLVGLCLLIILFFFKGIMQKEGEKYHFYTKLVHQWSLQLFSGIKEVLVLKREDFFVKNYEKAYANQQNAQIKQTVAAETPAYIIEGTCIVGIIIAVCIRVGGMETPAEYFPQLASFAVAAFRLLPSIGRVSSYFNGCIFYLPAVEEVYENIVEAQKYEADNTIKKIDEGADINNLSFEKEIKIQNIVWKYPDGKENVLDHISLTIKKGESVAFVGSSGSGKSTLADIILGLFLPQEGEILIDGINVVNNRRVLSRIISFVPQNVYLIDDTIRRNIAFGIEDTEIMEEAVWSALEQAQMKSFVEGLPDGVDTIVGERGVRFSGGQTQRLAIARALYTNPDILVLDEATSALDAETETAVMEAIEEMQGQKTLIIIAHRLSTIRNCDCIYEIAGGKIIRRQYEEL